MTTFNQDDINKFYQKRFEGPDAALTRLTNLKYSGLSLVDKIRSGESVIDIGCGQNIFKRFIPNLIGIDPVYDAADYKVDLQSFVTDKKFNVAFCLGSISNGDVNDIEQQIKKVVDLLTPTARIYWRIKPGLNDLSEEFYKGVTKYPWTLEDVYMFAEKFGFRVAEHGWDILNTTEPTRERLYAEWIRD